jgi:serine/threonine protein kinase
MSTLREGDRISNYLLEACVGSGSFGEVWRARHHVFGDIVAIKVPTDAQYVRNLRREGVAIHGLNHPNIVRAIDLDPYGDPPYLVMEYVDGPSLRAAIDEHGRDFPIDAAVAILRGILHALTAAHGSGLTHRDVKPANVLLNHPLDQLASISEQAVRVTDFGLGRVGGVTTHSIMQSGSLVTEDGRSVAGTLAYMSPEQKEGKEADARSDLYSCGIVLFEMLTGERPQGGDMPSSLRPGVPRHLDEVFRRTYTRRDRRFESAPEMLAAMTPDGRKADAPSAPRWVPSGGEPRCPACDAPVHRDDQFCIRCGHQLVASVPRCNACQAFVHAGDRFCIFCGNDLRVLKR